MRDFVQFSFKNIFILNFFGSAFLTETMFVFLKSKIIYFKEKNFPSKKGHFKFLDTKTSLLEYGPSYKKSFSLKHS
jgi:hypothetical protein